MRGKADSEDAEDDGGRITPAYAGKRNFWRLRCGSMWDHPRVCGEKFPGWELQKCVVGSPPRMRGKAGTESSTPTSARITPAYAGKRNGQSPTMLLRRDHPRVCGEKWPAALYEEMERGITPAYAGKRACTAVCSTNATGSPPRMRGKAFPQGVHVVVVGITPAYAGKSHADHQRRQLA